MIGSRCCLCWSFGLDFPAVLETQAMFDCLQSWVSQAEVLGFPHATLTQYQWAIHQCRHRRRFLLALSTAFQQTRSCLQLPTGSTTIGESATTTTPLLLMVMLSCSCCYQRLRKTKRATAHVYVCVCAGGRGVTINAYQPSGRNSW